MREALLFWSLLVPTQDVSESAIPVQSVVISLIDDVDLAMGEAGIIATIHSQPGKQVQRGDLLAQLDTTDAQLGLQHVQTELALAELKAANDLSLQLSVKSLRVAETELLRAERSNEKFKDTVSASEIDRLKLTRDEAELQIQQAKQELIYQNLLVRLKQAEVAIAQRNLERRQLRSPMDGMVVKMLSQPGEWILPDQALCRIVSLNRVRAEGFVSTDHGDVQIGQPVVVAFALEKSGVPQNFPGTITFVDPEIDTITGQYRVWAEVENISLKLRPGHRPTMVIHPVTSAPAITGPSDEVAR